MSYLLDANVLIDAFRTDAPAYTANRDWLTRTLLGGETVYAPALVEVALLRITTLLKLGPRAASPATAFAFLNALHAVPNYKRLELETGQFGGFEQTVQTLALSGNDLNDAYLVALAQWHNLTLVTADAGFSRFKGNASKLRGSGGTEKVSR
ncbi:TA system VapC family ribonuclease toxin [Deinococcus sp.]|uniref:TA system VapC family ribonuclease toxin n=1 Tax=Deinococcus sp. TaxID=47478 RepID=UPI003C7C880C